MNRLASRPPLLLDLGQVPDAHCDACLETLHKALAEDPRAEGDALIWARHDNPWIADHIEALTAWMQRILLSIQDAMAAALSGKPIGELRKAAPWERPDDAAKDAIRAGLAARSATGWTLADWLAFAELLMADYLPDDVIRDMAEFGTVRAQLTGKIAAALERTRRPVPGGRAAALAAALPLTRANLPPKVLSPIEAAILDIATERAAIFIGDLADDARKRIKVMVTDGVRANLLGQRDGTDEALRDRLFQEFGTLNRDFRRIAVTEVGEAHNTGFVAGHAPGTRLMRREAYRGACEFCASINGRVFRVVDPSDPSRDGDRDVWVGKTNAGRSASPRRREGGVLVERSPDSRWWVAAGVMHPHCRGRWVLAAPEADDPRAQDGADPEFMAWLRGELDAAGFPPARGKD